MKGGKIIVNINTQTDIVVCYECNGEGFKMVRTSAYDSEQEICNVCGGRGTLRKIVTTKYKRNYSVGQ